MSKFFVSPSARTDLEIPPEDLKRALVSRWPNVQIENVEDGNRSFTWSLNAANGLLDGYLNRKRQVVVLDGDVRDCAEFAQWYRQFVDSRFELVFYDDGYTNSVPVTSGVSVRELSSPWIAS